MVSSSFGMTSTLLAGLVDNLIGLETWTQAPYTYSDVTDCSKAVWVQIDLGQIKYLRSVTFWNYYDGRIYCSLSVALSSSCMFTGEEVTVFSCTSFGTCPTHTASGYTVSFSAQNARCIRWASGRSTLDTGVHFMELSVSAG